MPFTLNKSIPSSSIWYNNDADMEIDDYPVSNCV